MIKKIVKIGPDFSLDKSDQPEKRKQASLEKESKLLANYLSLGWYLVTPIIIGLLTGLFLDRLFGTKPIFVLALTLLGCIGTFYNLIKISKLK